jgi:EAL domain-containing protein (putative c-di-GMP-specific phosphodiesterase class I)
VIQHLKACCEKNEINMEKMALDIEEKSLVHMSESQKQVISDLRQLGVKIQIDDYGNQASILSSLIEFECDMVKVDSSILKGFENTEKLERHCRLIHALSESMGFEIIAEGVETQEQVEQLKSLQCLYAQGHYYGEAMNYESLLKFLDSHRIVN